MNDLKTPVLRLGQFGASLAKRLKKLRIETLEDLIFYFPFRHDDFSNLMPISKVASDSTATIKGKIDLISNRRSWAKRKILTEALVSDDSGSIKVIWFNQPFLTRVLKPGDRVFLSGRIEYDRHLLQFVNPVYEVMKGEEAAGIHTARIVPIYPLTSAITQKQIRALVKISLNSVKLIKDWLPKEIKDKWRLMDLSTALLQIHFPNSKEMLELARHRLKFDELFLFQLQTRKLRQELDASPAVKIPFKQKEIKKFVDSLPFVLTKAQKVAAWEVIKDLDRGRPMNRLVEGDVGSGKTLVATIAALHTVLDGHKAVFMAPTEILARQHFGTISRVLKGWPISVGLLTRNESKIIDDLGVRNFTKTEMIEKISKGDIQIMVGTHALIQEKVKFRDLALLIVDEQHRFGVEQRAKLLTRTRRGPNADLTLTNTQTIKEQINICGETDNFKLLYEEITYKMRGAAFTVKKNIGLGHKEVIYQRALAEEFYKIGLNFEKEKIIDIIYNDKKIGIYRPDFVVENKVIVEIKALPFVGGIEEKQLWSYLKGSKYGLALLINFGGSDILIKRVVYEAARSKNKSELLQSAPSLISAVSVQSALCPHLLSMTATPIPRTLALAFYGDLDLSIIDEMPAGRKKIITKIIETPQKMETYKFVREEIKAGRQAFVVCPLIDPSDKIEVQSVQEEYQKLSQKIFPEFKIGFLHGKLKPDDKEKIMKDFLDNKINILVSTSVIEVGIDVPNATVMMIEGAERFGLAQLHQFRGRVGRGDCQSYCFLFTENSNIKTRARLEALVLSNNGFELAEKDLELRGPGEVYGLKQSGVPSLKIATLSDRAIIKEAKNAVDDIIKLSGDLKEYPDLQARLENLDSIHLE